MAQEAAQENESFDASDIGSSTGEQDRGASSNLNANCDTNPLLPNRGSSQVLPDSEISVCTDVVTPTETQSDRPPTETRDSATVITINPIEIEADSLLQIDHCPKLKRILQDWEKRFKVASLRIEKKNTRSFNAKSELYQLIGFYFVFQGVVLTAVAQTDRIHCNQSWGPALLSLLASIATILSVYNKLKNYSDLKGALEGETTDSKALQARIWQLKTNGINFKFPQPKEEEGRKTSKGLEPIYLYSVVLALVLFSLIILASCLAILCQYRPSS